MRYNRVYIHPVDTMKIFQKITLSFAVLFCFLAVSATKVFANENFDTRLTSTYTVDAVGVTKVSHKFEITNKEPTIFLTQYALKTSYPELKNVIVRYNNDILIPNVVQDGDGTSIAIDFPDEVVGEGKTRTFSIEYVNTNLSTLAGAVLEMHVPQSPEAAAYSSHKSIISVPEKFGYPSRVSPEPKIVETKDNAFVLTFEDHKDSAITALFGNSQIYSLTLRYQLENSTSGTALAQIALPPDTAFQKIHIRDIDPYPEDLKVDADGNWIATYQISPTSATNVYVSALARVSIDPNTSVPVPVPTKKMKDKAEYWNTDAPVIQDLVRKYKTPQDIYDYIVETLSYSKGDLSAGSARMGAVKAFENPTAAVCQEFSDTFITVARAAGIPARRNVGYGYAENSSLRPSSFQGDLLHAWPEYWNDQKQLWIPVDPTWGNTTRGIDYFTLFDLNHIVFAINGESSSTPYPAGSYKATGNENAQDVEVTFATDFPEIQPAVEVTLEPKRVFGIPLPGIMTAHIINKTGQAWYNVSLKLTSDDADVTISSAIDSLPVLLPYERKNSTVTAYQKAIALPKTVAIQPVFTFSNGTSTFEATTVQGTAGPQIVEYVTDQTIIIALAGSSVILALIAGSILVFRQRR
ncbi:MAG: hypothetical protein CO156_00060 [Candidatus Pacebacteria bacterium CG_4_9_14_3_um_filter_40_12]|nr:MAG: hypothetical protein COU64_01880 [Candidatus Pacebacteria bacterium CG10_big_fil_rev_8_21_14_0_10_40_26]PIZ78427.1 MAG: hypothetical protein COY01_04175 [Candidatus Pacebacteria bacterium CG_4_10_14_0_2_um_filter_40_20]PJA69277.1 MAG: hypothetical protein CO156_00060 [Candidatus Pacebacteria bacterium CG_4_9_14_3_um_filter_40_12]PJC41960.1 MAG: hypothetical protein CO041_01615 [Candidatus Pacebacteria bacterium CG_4_9_14_0_2_um_filter_40_15]